MKKIIGRPRKKRKMKNGTLYTKSFGKWKQTRYSDGVKYPVVKYNLNDVADSNKKETRL